MCVSGLHASLNSDAGLLLSTEALYHKRFYSWHAWLAYLRLESSRVNSQALGVTNTSLKLPMFCLHGHWGAVMVKWVSAELAAILWSIKACSNALGLCSCALPVPVQQDHATLCVQV
jgi:hypothetical protein